MEGQQAPPPAPAIPPPVLPHDDSSDDLPSIPPSSPRRGRSGTFIGLGLGLLLVLAGLFAGVYAAYLHESGPHHEHHRGASAFSGMPPMTAAPTGVNVLEPVTATATATARVDDSAEPLRPLGTADANR